MSYHNDTFRAVYTAIHEGKSAAQFIKEAWDAWDDAQAEKQRMDNAEFKQAVKGSI